MTMTVTVTITSRNDNDNDDRFITKPVCSLGGPAADRPAAGIYRYTSHLAIKLGYVYVHVIHT